MYKRQDLLHRNAFVDGLLNQFFHDLGFAPLEAARAMNMGAQLLKPLMADAGVEAAGKVCIGTVLSLIHIERCIRDSYAHSSTGRLRPCSRRERSARSATRWLSMEDVYKRQTLR